MTLLRASTLCIAAACSLLSFTSPAHAGDTTLPAGHPIAERCRAEPQKCREAREKWLAWCKQNPDRCADIKQRRKELREQCHQDPSSCAEKRKQMHEKIEQLRHEGTAAPGTPATTSGS